MKSILQRFSQLTFLLALSLGAVAQNPEGFDKMAKKMADKTVPIIKSAQVVKLQKKGKKVIFLDTRELKEYNVSHIKDAIHIGYNNFKMKSVAKLNKNATIIVYCSVGYRSGKIGKKLREAGFTSVFNLYGGLFDWANNGNPIFSKKGAAKKVHPYNTKWGKWLKPELHSKLD